jgi:succinate dehydrogenase / fumarate reductase, iron-sulfur subunit
MSKRTVQFSIYRYDPDKDDAPYMQDISVESSRPTASCWMR